MPATGTNPKTRVGRWAQRHPWMTIILIVILSSTIAFEAGKYSVDQERSDRVDALARLGKTNCQRLNRQRDAFIESVRHVSTGSAGTRSIPETIAMGDPGALALIRYVNDNILSGNSTASQTGRDAYADALDKQVPREKCV